MKTSEMMAKLEENPKLKFKCSDGRIFGRNTSNETSSGTYCGEINGYAFTPKIDLTTDWELVRIPVTWQEAIQAWTFDGKDVECRDCKGTCCNVCDECEAKEYEDFISSKNNESADLDICKGQLLTGTWFIRDDADA